MASHAQDQRLSRPSHEAEPLENLLKHHDRHADEDSDDNHDDAAENMPLRSTYHASVEGHSHQPLLKEDARGRDSNTFPGALDGHSTRPPTSRRSTFRSRTPDVEEKNLTRKKYIMASGFLLLSLVSFVVQTETAVYIQHELHWNKPYCML